MNYRIILSPGARADLQAAIRWYRREDLNLSVRFRADTRAILRRIQQNPRAFPVLRDMIRRALLNEFPYSVYFYVSGNIVFVRAILHQRRADALWRYRRNGRN